MESFQADLGISHHRVALYSPKQNDQVEHFNRVLSEKIKEATKFDWDITKTVNIHFLTTEVRRIARSASLRLKFVSEEDKG